MPSFDPNSRYFDVKTATLTITDASGEARRVVYKCRRFLPRLDQMLTVSEQPLQEGTRIDHVASEQLDDPQLFWQICDANPVMHPDELTSELGLPVRIAAPALGGSGRPEDLGG